jgi:hypothetical protein
MKRWIRRVQRFEGRSARATSISHRAKRFGADRETGIDEAACIPRSFPKFPEPGNRLVGVTAITGEG